MSDCPNCAELRLRFKRLLDAKELEAHDRELDAFRAGFARGLKEGVAGDVHQADVPLEEKNDS